MITQTGQGRRAFHYSIAAAILLLTLGCTPHADTPPAAAAPPATRPATAPVREIAIEGNLVTRVYDLRDLTTPIDDFVPPTFGISPRNAATTKPATKPTTILGTTPDFTKPLKSADILHEIAKLITDTIDPAAWDPATKGVATLREKDGHLIIRADRALHARIADLLAQLREARQLQVTIEARFILVDEPTYQKLEKDIFAPAKVSLAGQSAQLPTELTGPQVNAILNLTQQSQRTTTLSAPRLTVFNGQRAYVLVATQRAYIADLKLSRDAAGKPRLEPEIDIVESGMLFDVQPTVSADRKYVTANLRPSIAQLEKIVDVPFETLPPELNDLKPRPTIQQPILHLTEVRSVVSIQNRQTILLGGQKIRMDLNFTGQPNPADNPRDNAPKPAEMGHLLILIKPTIIQG